MDKEREVADKLREALRARIELLVLDLSHYTVLAHHKPGEINTYDYLLASSCLIHDSSERIFDSSERLNALTRRLNRLTLTLIVLAALAFVAALRDIFCL
jgi:hypothetical protein